MLASVIREDADGRFSLTTDRAPGSLLEAVAS